jgi:hypothetical protein
MALNFVGFDDNEPGDSDEEGNEKELTLQSAKKTSGNPLIKGFIVVFCLKNMNGH